MRLCEVKKGINVNQEKETDLLILICENFIIARFDPVGPGVVVMNTRNCLESLFEKKWNNVARNERSDGFLFTGANLEMFQFERKSLFTTSQHHNFVFFVCFLFACFISTWFGFRFFSFAANRVQLGVQFGQSDYTKT